MRRMANNATERMYAPVDSDIIPRCTASIHNKRELPYSSCTIWQVSVLLNGHWCISCNWASVALLRDDGGAMEQCSVISRHPAYARDNPKHDLAQLMTACH
jgi:hypothetical protein